MPTDLTPRTAAGIEALTPGLCWDIYVGDQTVPEFMDGSEDVEGEVRNYVNDSPACDDLTPEAADALCAKLTKYIVEGG